MASFDLDLRRDNLVTGLDHGAIEQMSQSKVEPKWMTELRSDSLRLFHNEPVSGGPSTTTLDSGVDVESIGLPPRPTDECFGASELTTDEHELVVVAPVGRAVRGRDAAGVANLLAPDEVDRDRLRGLVDQGVVFCDMDTGLSDHPELVKKYFGTAVSPGDNKFAALNTAVWSGGVFIYVPPGVEVDLPLQTSRRTRSEHPGQFQRTLIVADEGSTVHYIEGCSAPMYTSESLHSAVVEIVVEPNARVGYTSIQNWSPNVCNVVTKGARVEAGGRIDWTECNIGARLTATTPTVRLVGPGAEGEVHSVGYAGAGQRQATGANMLHSASNTVSKIVSKSISKDGGVTVHNGVVRREVGAVATQSHAECDALILDDDSVAEIAADIDDGDDGALAVSELTVAKIDDQQLFYLMSRGLSREQAMGLIVNGFIEPILRTLPTEYAVEWSRLIELQMDGSVG